MLPFPIRRLSLSPPPPLLPPLSLSRAFKVVLALEFGNQFIVCGEFVRGRKSSGNRRSNSPLSNGWCCHIVADCLLTRGTCTDLRRSSRIHVEEQAESTIKKSAIRQSRYIKETERKKKDSRKEKEKKRTARWTVNFPRSERVDRQPPKGL